MRVTANKWQPNHYNNMLKNLLSLIVSGHCIDRMSFCWRCNFHISRTKNNFKWAERRVSCRWVDRHNGAIGRWQINTIGHSHWIHVSHWKTERYRENRNTKPEVQSTQPKIRSSCNFQNRFHKRQHNNQRSTTRPEAIPKPSRVHYARRSIAFAHYGMGSHVFRCKLENWQSIEAQREKTASELITYRIHILCVFVYGCPSPGQSVTQSG